MQLQLVDGIDSAGKSEQTQLHYVAQPFAHNREHRHSCRFSSTKSGFELPCCKAM